MSRLNAILAERQQVLADLERDSYVIQKYVQDGYMTAKDSQVPGRPFILDTQRQLLTDDDKINAEITALVAQFRAASQKLWALSNERLELLANGGV